MKILGLVISDDLKWTSHVAYLVPKLTRLCHALRLLRLSYSTLDLSVIFHAVFVPTMLYSSAAWCNISMTNLERLQRIATRAGRLAGATLDVRECINMAVMHLFTRAMSPSHPLHCLLPGRTSTHSARRARLPPSATRTERLNKHFIASAIRFRYSRQVLHPKWAITRPKNQ